MSPFLCLNRSGVAAEVFRRHARGAMPFACPLSFHPVSDATFAEWDKRVMSCAYASQTELGRLCEEHVYENDIAERLRADGVEDVRTQVPLIASHRGFTKVYRLDLVVVGIVYELKVAAGFVPAHDAQVYNYAAMLALDRIKLLNLGGAAVEGRLRRCPFARINRDAVTVERQRWRSLSDRCDGLASDAESCFSDWGGFIDGRLFEDALIWFNGGENACLRRLPVVRATVQLGHHRVAMHSGDVCFSVTSLGDGAVGYEGQIRRLLEALPIRGWQWINVHQNVMTMVTLSRRAE